MNWLVGCSGSMGTPPADPQDGHWPAQAIGHRQGIVVRADLEPILMLFVARGRQCHFRIFQIDHPRDELALHRQFQIFLRQFDGDGEAALLARLAGRAG